MKTGKRFLTTSVAIIFITVVASCSKGTDLTSTITKEQLLGSWKLVSIPVTPAITFSDGTKSTDLMDAWRKEAGSDCLEATQYQFTSNNLVRLIYPTECQVKLKKIFNWQQATYTLSGSTLFFQMSNGTQQYMIQADGKMMRWMGEMEAGTIDNISHQYTINLQQ